VNCSKIAEYYNTMTTCTTTDTQNHYTKLNYKAVNTINHSSWCVQEVSCKRRNGPPQFCQGQHLDAAELPTASSIVHDVGSSWFEQMDGFSEQTVG
jgi:hypothetical protein